MSSDPWNGFRGAAKRIDDVDLPRIGHVIGVGEDEIHALLDVETSGSGFDRHGRPKMLFEPHVFYRNLKGAKRDAAVAAGLAYAAWRPGAYPSDSYPRLARAMTIDFAAALKAASWGLGQILGENHRMAGYGTIQEMVRVFMEDEECHLEAMVAFIKSAKIDDEMRAIARLGRPSTPQDWAPIAYRYNGAKYAAHNYHGRLAAAHRKWKAIRNTPWTPGMEIPSMTTVAAPAAPDAAVLASQAAEPKEWYKSKRVWGIIITIASTVLGSSFPALRGLDPSLIAEGTAKLASAIGNGGGIIGAAITLLGLVVGDRPIKGTAAAQATQPISLPISPTPLEEGSFLDRFGVPMPGGFAGTAGRIVAGGLGRIAGEEDKDPGRLTVSDLRLAAKAVKAIREEGILGTLGALVVGRQKDEAEDRLDPETLAAAAHGPSVAPG